MDNPMYTSILEEYLLPFIQDVYPDGHKFMQDNDPKHTSRHLQAFFAENRINWWKTAPESPDANPIENLWHELKASFCSYKTFCALI
jgi:transposase